MPALYSTHAMPVSSRGKEQEKFKKVELNY